ncbi:MAG2-interacting protein 2 isoform X2 [Malania oleifera]|uniref:MAG2-interacting protein 2 isoform X2 n=1 Tax=Malania oleifera TaxID=397392 RepID=UPI0025AE2A37|nr:MAG2-interacting protein 2 isoform X2 [Malania oleifera]
MEANAREVLYEPRHHASRPYFPNYPPQQLNEGAKRSFLSFLSVPGVSQLKEKWREYRNPRKVRKWVSLFISPRGERVAVAVGNQITILQKGDDYREPCGIFTSASSGLFTCGTWSECHDVLGVADDADTLYFIKGNGEEIIRLTKRHLQVSLPVIGLIVPEDNDTNGTFLCSFNILTSDGLLHHIEISREPSSSVSSMCTLKNRVTLKRQFPENVFCLDYHPELSLLVLVGSAVGVSPTSGPCYLSLWRRARNLDLELLFSIQFEGVFSKPRDYVGPKTFPKVLISPQGKFVATLDLIGCLEIFKLDEEFCSLSKFSYGKQYGSQVTDNLSNGRSKSLSGNADFIWWSDHILALANTSGSVAMLDIISGMKLLEDDVYSMPVLERGQRFQGQCFLLESTLPEGRKNFHSNGEKGGLSHIELVTDDGFNLLDMANWRWSLISFSERSVPEMYNLLISNQKYQAALDFSDRHGLDKSEIFKSQWLHCGQGINDINLFLSNIKDQAFVISECVDKVGSTEDAAKALLAYGLRRTDQYRFTDSEDQESSQIWDFRMERLKLLQYRDRLETFLGINMGRFSVQEYRRFRIMPINETAVRLAESGKIGALNLLFKRHPYSLSPSMLKVLAAIPETVPVQTYGQLLPGRLPPSSIALREKDWVECEKMVDFVNGLPENQEVTTQIKTEPVVQHCYGFLWPSINELCVWYKNRARDIDTYCGQLDNGLCLVDFACRKGICELQQFHKDISYLHQLVYSGDGDDEMNFTMSLVAWEQLSDFEKFRMMLKGVKEETVVERLHDKAIPFMRTRLPEMTPISEDWVRDNHFMMEHEKAESYLIRWLKEIASENKLDICLIVIEEGCKEFQNNGIFKDEVEAVYCALKCIYLCTVTDRWSTMATILSKLPQIQDTDLSFKSLEKKRKLAEGHIEAGRLLAFYQVPKPLSFFLEANSDGKSVKQILRLLLSKFIRRQPGRSDNDWASMWRDMQCLREKAFPFLDLEYMLVEFCRGLLKAGKFSLARNYLKGTGSVSLASEKAENLVIQAAREYFFSASSLACSEIWKAKECLNLLPSSRNVKVEADIIDALTVRLPDLGVTILPMQFRQIKDPMEIIKMAITSQSGAYLHVDELIEIAKLLGLGSLDDSSAVEEAIAREAAVAGDLQLAFDLCLVLAKKGHGLVWDLCAAIARGPALENMDIRSRKQLLGFALSHCDEESIGELLHAWKDLDMQGQCENLMVLTGTSPPNFSVQGSSIISLPVHSIQDIVKLNDSSELAEQVGSDNEEVHVNSIKNIISAVAKNFPIENGTNLESLLRENGKLVAFAALQLPWLLGLSTKADHEKKLDLGTISGKQYASIRAQAVVSILSWLARNGFAPRDDLIASLAKSILEPPVTEEEDIIGCSFLLNLVDAFNGVEVIEEQLRTRKDYREISHIMSMGMTYSLLHSFGVECEGPAQRRELLLRKFRGKHLPLSSDEMDRIGVHSTFWREWKLKLEEQKHIADRSRVLERIIPGVETARFLSGDFNYIQSVVFSLIESVKFEKKHILKDVLKLADTYSLSRTKVLLQYLSSVLLSEVWSNDDIAVEISEVKGEILASAVESIKIISLVVYPAIDGSNKLRLAFIYRLLTDCYINLKETEEPLPVMHPNPPHLSTFGLVHFYEVMEQECIRISFLKNLNFKNIAGLGGLNFECFRSEVYKHIDELSLEALAKMVDTLVSTYDGPFSEGLISQQDVYKHYVLSLLATLESRAKTDIHIRNPDDHQGLIIELEHAYDSCGKYIRIMTSSDALDIMKRYLTAAVPLSGFPKSLLGNLMWQDCLIMVINFWIRLTDDMQEITSDESSYELLKFNPECLLRCLRSFMRLVMEESVSPSQGWATVISYVKYGIVGDSGAEIFIFCRSMVFSGCGFGGVAVVFSEAVQQFSVGSIFSVDADGNVDHIQDIPHLYINILEPILQDLVSESHDHQNLFSLLSSLSKLEGDLEELKMVRHAVWERMTKFSENLQLPSHVRVYALELMQCISGRNFNLSAERQPNALPWEGWDELPYTSENSESTCNEGAPTHMDTSSRFTSTLVALKSSQLAAAISPSTEITPDELLTVDTAVSCFLKLCEAAITDSHIDALLAILAEWEGIFVIGKIEETPAAEVSDEGNWNNDDWDEGWESFQEEPSEKEKEESCVSLHPLHACWMEILKKLSQRSRFDDVLKLIDQSLEKSSGKLLDEDGARSLGQIVLDIDCFMALKMVLLLPYEVIQLHCLDAVENKLKQGGIPDAAGRGHELLILALSSGIVSTIITKSSYDTIFSLLCYLVGNFAHQLQEAELLKHRDRVKNGREKNDSTRDFLFLFRKILFPCFISELVKADQHILAGFLVTKYMHTNASLSLINVAEASLERYLENQLQNLQEGGFSSEELKSCETLGSTVSNLRSNLGNIIRSALSSLPANS